MTLDVRKDLTEEELDSFITVREIRQTGACVQGQKRWFTAHGFDFKDVMKNGARIRDIMEKADGESDFPITRIIEKRRAEADGW